MNTTTLCIPRMRKVVTKNYIKHKLGKCNFGTIHSISEMPLRYENDFKKVLICITINKERGGMNLLENMNNQKSVKVVHSEYEYWKIIKANQQNNERTY